MDQMVWFDQKGQIKHEHYLKEVSHKGVILSDSDMPNLSVIDLHIVVALLLTDIHFHIPDRQEWMCPLDLYQHVSR